MFLNSTCCSTRWGLCHAQFVATVLRLRPLPVLTELSGRDRRRLLRLDLGGAVESDNAPAAYVGLPGRTGKRCSERFRASVAKEKRLV